MKGENVKVKGEKVLVLNFPGCFWQTDDPTSNLHLTQFSLRKE